MAVNRNAPSEFGGRPGLIQTADDGHTHLTAREEAMVLRMRGRYEAGGLTDDEIAIREAERQSEGR